jgi:hypothetical protein
MDALALSEQDELKHHEGIIDRGLKTFVDVGFSLLAIRDGRLYRAGFSTFEDYCRERWGFARTYAFYMIEAAKVVENLSVHYSEQLPATETQARPLAQLDLELQQAAWQQVIDTAPDGKITAAHIQSVVDEIQHKPKPESVHVSDDSYEWYTPVEYIDAVREVMGWISLDPATCPKANEIVKAETIFTKDDNGLLQDWHGRVFLNPPYNMPLVEQFTSRAIREYKNADIEEAIVLVNNATDTGWFHALLENYPVCFTRGRVQFWNPEGPNLGARQGQAFFYLGRNPAKFAEVFSQFGIVVGKYDDK